MVVRLNGDVAFYIFVIGVGFLACAEMFTIALFPIQFVVQLGAVGLLLISVSCVLALFLLLKSRRKILPDFDNHITNQNRGESENNES